MNNLLSLENLEVEFHPGDPRRCFHAVKQVSLSVDRGETLGVVGESGCGKSLTALSMLDLQPPNAHPSGNFTFDGNDYQLGSDQLHNLRGTEIGMIFQEPMTALNPVYSVGEQLRETLKYMGYDSSDRRTSRALELLKRVHLDRPEQRMNSYPHELSGGQRQRVMIALSLAGEPDLLIADEPTTALDVTIESRIMDLFEELASQGLSILFVSHDLRLVADLSDRIVVMYSGYSVETAPSGIISDSPQHPYTQGLMKSSATMSKRDEDRLPVIEGDVPDPADRPDGCPFHPRCPEREPRCEDEFPSTFEPLDGDHTACWARENGSSQ